MMRPENATDGAGQYAGGFSNDTAVELFNRFVDGRRPIVLGLTGARYCGKTHFTERAARLLNDEKIPCAKVDAAKLLADQPEDLLDHLVAAFTDGHGRAVRFPRYLLARSVLEEEITPPAPLNVRTVVSGVLRATWRNDDLPDAVADLTAAVAELHGLPATGIRDGLTRIVRGVLNTDVGAALVRRPRAAWFAANELLEWAESPVAGLARLWEWCHTGDWEQRRDADYVLAAALLADVRESVKGASWHGGYAVLLDNADAGRAAIRLVRALAHVIGAQDRAVIAVTHRGGLLAEVRAVVGGEPVVEPVNVPPAGPGARPPEGTQWWPLRLPDLKETGVRAMLREATDWDELTGARAAEAVYRLTRGHLGTTADICGKLATRRQPAGEYVELADLVDAKALSRRLTGPLDDAAEAALQTCSAVRDQEHVGPLFGDDDNAVSVVKRAELWVPGRAGRLVLLPVLRRFLLRRLAERSPGAPDGWDTVFTHLATYARDDDDEESELYYRLALGETEPVTRHLYDRLSGGDPAGWIELHRYVTLAPGRFGDGPYSAVLARHKAWAAEEGAAMRALADLVVRLWLAAEPFSDPPLRDDIRDAVQSDYGDLADRFSAAEPLLRLEKAWWG